MHSDTTSECDDDISLTSDELSIIYLSMGKIDILKRAVEAGLPVTLTDENMKFIKYSREEFENLMNKLDKLEKVAWLKEQVN